MKSKQQTKMPLGGVKQIYNRQVINLSAADSTPGLMKWQLKAILDVKPPTGSTTGI